MMPSLTRRLQRPDGKSVAGQLVSLTTWAALPMALTVFTVLGSRGGKVHFAGDYHYAFWPAGQRVLHGLGPYVDPGSPAVTHAVAFVYPALAALLFAPLALIPHGAGDAIFAGLNFAAALLTLRVLNVRDWRLYGLLVLCPAVYSGWTLANVTLLLGLGIAAGWRYREQPFVIGVLVAVLISVKLFLWPLLLWLLATRRYAALAYAAACGLALNAAAWTVLGFHELHRYSRLLHRLATVEERQGYSLIALARRMGIDHSGAYALAFGLAAGLAVICLVSGRRGRDVPALALAIAVCLLATPVVQLHYFALLIVPLALVRPRLDLAWGLLLVMWACASAAPQRWQIAAALTIGGAVVAIATRRDSRAPKDDVPVRAAEQATSPPSLDLRLVLPSASSVATGEIGR